MITRLSQLFVRTLRDDPADAEVSSHRWLVRAGYVRRVTPGIYSWLPLGLKVLQKVEAIVRVSPMRPPAGGPNTARICSGSGTAGTPTCYSAPPMRRCSP